jgi:hypothetical protein
MFNSDVKKGVYMWDTVLALLVIGIPLLLRIADAERGTIQALVVRGVSGAAQLRHSQRMFARHFYQ